MINWDYWEAGISRLENEILGMFFFVTVYDYQKILARKATKEKSKHCIRITVVLSYTFQRGSGQPGDINNKIINFVACVLYLW